LLIALSLSIPGSRASPGDTAFLYLICLYRALAVSKSCFEVFCDFFWDRLRSLMTRRGTPEASVMALEEVQLLEAQDLVLELADAILVPTAICVTTT
jgi:hypothetical protein